MVRILKIEFKLSAVTAKQADVDARPQIAFAGRSNVGKSTLLNALANQRHLAKVSNTPGATRMINLFLVNDAFYFADLPGYGYAKVARSVKEEWGRELENYLATAKRLAGVVAIFDARREMTPEDGQLVDWLAHMSRPIIPVITKIDKLRKNELAKSAAAWRRALAGRTACDPVLFSGLDQTGKSDLLKRIGEMVDGRYVIKAPAEPADAAPPETAMDDDGTDDTP